MDKDYLAAAARAVDIQATENPTLGIPVDHDVAEFMGAFGESAVCPDDLDDIFFNDEVN
jgi:hypothetical protein